MAQKRWRGDPTPDDLHSQSNVDYATVVDLSRHVIVEWPTNRNRGVLNDAQLCGLFSDEGPTDLNRYSRPTH